MNKKETISKINKYGKIGKIITIIMLVILIIVTATTFIAAIALKTFPDDLILINIGTQAEMTLNPSAVSQDISQVPLEEIVNAFNSSNYDAGLNLGAVRMKFESAQIVDNKILCKTNDGMGTVSLNSIGNALFLVDISLILTIISIIFGVKFCKSVEKCESPFENNVIKNMRYLAFSLLPWALFSSVPEYVVNNLFNNNIQMGFSLDMNIILTVLIILALTVVFKYGAMLQQESDETL